MRRRPTQLKTERLKETLKKCLESKKHTMVDKMMINHHTSEFRRQFKSKSPADFHTNRATLSYEQEMSKFIHSSMRVSADAMSPFRKTTTQREVPNRSKQVRQYLS